MKGEGSQYTGWGKVVFEAAKAMNRVACVVLFALMVLTMADVFGRKLFSDSILGTVELSEFALAVIVFLSLAFTEFADGHVRVDLIMVQFGERTRAIVDMITQFACFVLSFITTCSTFSYAEKMRASGEVSQDLWLPKHPFIYLAVVGFAVLTLTMLIRFFLACRKAVRP